MLHIKIFLSLLLISVLSAFYGAYYFSNFYDFDTKVEVKQEWIDTEKDLFETYRFDEIVPDEESELDYLSNETGSYFLSGEGLAKNSLSIIETIPNNKNGFLGVNGNIEILFSNYVELESLLGYIEGTGATITCPSGKVVDMAGGFGRCNDLNKIFLYKKGEERTMFSGVIKRLESDKKRVSLEPVPPLENKSAYVLEIESGIKILSKNSDLKTKEGKVVNFIVLDMGGEDSTGTGIVAGTGALKNTVGTGEILTGATIGAGVILTNSGVVSGTGALNNTGNLLMPSEGLDIENVSVTGSLLDNTGSILNESGSTNN